jgi:putative ubiquitin-RnfH superfamily antitoxin RatB of RatAB toxin-antitoxin module
MKVSIAYATEKTQIWRPLEIADGATVEDVIAASGLLDTFTIDIKKQKVGIYGKLAKLKDNVCDGDRIEIYQPITRVLDDEDEEDDD